MAPIKLNLNEKKVTYGLVRYPDASDLELSRLIGVRRPTITKIRNKVFKLGLVETCYVPNFQALGMEMLVFWQGRFNASVLPGDWEDENKGRPYIVISARSIMEGLGMSTFKNFTRYREHSDNEISSLMKSGVLKSYNDYTVYFYPFETSQIDAYFDYAPILKTLMGLDNEDSQDEAEYPPRSTPQLSDKEKAILVSMVENPGLSDSKMSSLLGISRPTMSEKRNTFVQQGLIRKRNLPHIQLIGMEIIALFHFKFNPVISDDQKKHVITEMLDKYRPFIQVSDKLDCTGMFLVKMFDDYKRLNDEHLFRMVDEGLILDKVQLVVIPVNNVKVKVLNLAPTLRYSLDFPMDS